MTVNPERFDTLIKQLEGYASKHPQTYRWRVTLLIILGYAYILLILGSIAALLVAVVAIEYAILVVIGLASLFWVKITPPIGVPVDRARFPVLFEEIDRLSAQLNTPKIDRVLLTADLNAAVLESPKFGLFGWYTNYLLLGVPLMQSVTPGQFQATLAHELGHLSGKHSRFSGWVYRIRRAWALLSAQQGDRVSILMYPFFKWYEPFFRAYSFVLSRSDEYYADRCAAEYAGTQNAAEDLLQIYIKGHHAVKIWADFYRCAAQQPQPPDNAVSSLLEHLATPITPEEAATWLELELARQTDHHDTHPCLSARLQAYGYCYTTGELPLPLTIEKTAANHFLGKEADWAVAMLDQQWQTEQGKQWQQEYARAQLRWRFWQQLKQRQQSQALTVEESLKLALLTAEFGELAAAIAQLKTLVQQAPDHTMSHYRLGELLLQHRSLAGLQYLETAILQQPYLLVYGFECLYAGLKQQGRHEQAAAYLQQYREFYPLWQRSRQERHELTGKELFQPHCLSSATTKQITWQLNQYPELRAAYLARRQVKYLPENPCYVLGIMWQLNRHDPIHSLREWELVEVVSQTLCLSMEVRVVPFHDRQRQLYYSLRKVPGSKLV
ncbi:M48 family metalloprotease [Pantanalinema sp. GBBB05]|uniref:M48 family metallopeptidase n=1 Tax=Pantanalinema sp. GBBB05 TaxID=2604139 RepID=UPI003D815CD5